MMSRYTLKPIKPEQHDYEIVTGWDGGLQSFFGEVRRPSNDVFGGEVVRSIVPLSERLDALKEVIDAISEYAVIDSDLRATLWSDSERAA
jgi:hypothetical protein